MTQLHAKKVLLVEDDVNLRDILKMMCEKEGWIVLEAGDGEEGAKHVIEHKPSIVFLDLLMPKVDGFGFLKLVRKHDDPDVAKVPVVVLSNLYTNKDILMAEQLVIEAYFVKANTSLDQVIEKAREIITKYSK